MKTESQVQQDVQAELLWEPSVNASLIFVEVDEGCVKLRGQVSSYAQKWEAARAAQRVCGACEVSVAIEVALPRTSQRSDADMARSAKNILKWTGVSGAAEGVVVVQVDEAWITLSGTVDWDYQKQAVVTMVRNLTGVLGVDDQITVLPPATPSATLQADVETALARCTPVGGPSISVQIDGSSLTLTGDVLSGSDRDLAVHAAWGTPGVDQVTDRLTIVG